MRRAGLLNMNYPLTESFKIPVGKTVIESDDLPTIKISEDCRR